MNQNNKRLALLLIVLLISSCNRLQISVPDKAKLKTIKTIRMDDVIVKSLTFDPFLYDSLKALLEFELRKAGFQLLPKNISLTDNEPITADAKVKIMFLHNRYFRDVSEKDNLTFCFDMTGLTNEKICSIVYSDTSGKNLLNTQELQKAVSLVVKKLHPK